MFRSILLILLMIVATVLLSTALLQKESQAELAPDAAAPCRNIWQHEPILVYDVTGFTIAGGLRHLNLVVYNDGFATICKSDTIPFDEGVATAFTGTVTARTLLTDLALASAFTLCDQDLAAADIPLTTVTVMRGATDTLAHTFNYWVPDPPYTGVQSVINAFIATHFPGF